MALALYVHHEIATTIKLVRTQATGTERVSDETTIVKKALDKDAL